MLTKLFKQMLKAQYPPILRGIYLSTKESHICTLMLVYHCHKPVFTPKMAIIRSAEMRERGLPLPLAFQYLILLL